MKMMIDLNKLHEKETFQLDFAERGGQEVIDFFVRHGARLEDDFFCFYRTDTVRKWQTPSIWSADCWRSGIRVYPSESPVDRITISTLFSATPYGLFHEVTNIIKALIETFNARLSHKGTPLRVGDVDRLSIIWRDEIRDEVSEEPGQEGLAILIQEMFYQR